MLDFLIEQGAFISSYYLNEMTNAITYLCENKSVTASLLRKFMEENTTDPNHQECGCELVDTALSYLCRNTKVTPEMIGILIDNDANPNQEPYAKDTQDLPFLFLISNPNATPEHFEMLMDKGLHLNGNDKCEECYNSNFLTLIKSVAGKQQFLQLAFNKGGKLNIFDQYGNTPLIDFIKHHISSTDVLQDKRFIKIFNVLKNFMVYGSDPNRKNEDGKTAFDYLKTCKNLTEKECELYTELLNHDPYYLENDFEKFFTSGEFSDFEIKEIPIPKLILEMRTGMKCEEIKEILENSKKFSKKDILLFLKWVYFDNIFEVQRQSRNPMYIYTGLKKKQENSYCHGYEENHYEKMKKWEMGREKEKEKEKQEEMEREQERDILNQIFQELKLKQEFIEKKLRDSLKELYFDESTKDFTIIVNNERNESIKVHRLILIARSEFFRGMFLTIEKKKLKQVSDFTKKSIETFNILIKWLYFDTIPELSIVDIEETTGQLMDSIDYYQLNPRCNLKYLLLWDGFNLKDNTDKNELLIMSTGPTDEELRQAFDLIDTDGNGTLDENEIKQLFKQFGQELTDEEYKEMMSEVDTDGNGVVDFDEFKKMFL
ncbi:calmodulin-related [Anaeramoeba flamelloides]|uniref:Calmodulin-related n=1 Tax=Anaeramoeba flamelloides TaxID=1746091 RepID=A0AAV7ZYW4_9EUKA|nr:calmodulin-related [Anaeramoeba flamelloides]